MTIFDLRQLDRFRQMVEAGSELAPAAALHYCAGHRLPAPIWLTQAVSGAYCAQLNPNNPKKRGRSSGPIERYHQDMVDYIRWDELRECRQNQEKLQHDAQLLQIDYKNMSSRWKKPHLMMANWAGRDWLRAYDCVSMILRGTPAFGGPHAIKASYARVKKNQRHPVEKWRYFMFDPEFLESIGLEHPKLWGRSSKLVPLYNLTL